MQWVNQVFKNFIINGWDKQSWIVAEELISLSLF